MMRTMRAIARFLVALVGLAVVGAVGAWFWAGRAEGPSVTIRAPGAVIGQAGMLDMLVETPDGHLSQLVFNARMRADVLGESPRVAR